MLDFFILLARRKRLLFGTALLAGVAAAAVSLIMPEVYRAGTRLLPPQQPQSAASALLSQLGGVASVIGGGGVKNPNDVYIGMLRSRTLADSLVKRFDLMAVYGTNSPEKARLRLAENTLVTSGKEGLITIEVEDEGQKRVAHLANGYVEELTKMTKVLAVTEAAQRRLFFERQLELSKSNLEKAELMLKNNIGTRGVISVDSQSRAVVETGSRLRAQISAKEIQLGSMRAFVTSSNPEFLRVREELSSLQAELNRLENGRPAAGESQGASAAGLENVKTLRDLKYHQQLYELLAKQYEMARLDEAKDAAVIQVLDPAIEPERKVKPKRAVLVVISVILAVFGAITWIMVAEWLRRARSKPATAAKWRELSGLGRG